MLGIIIGTVSLFALIATLRRGRCHHRGGSSRRFKRLMQRLGASPSQEDSLRGVVDELFATGRATREDGLALTSALAAAFEKDALEEPALDEALARFDAASARMRAAIASGIRTVHTTLDASQRKTLLAQVSRRRFGRHAHA